MIQNDVRKNSQVANCRNPEDLTINFDTNLRRWFTRNLGVWKSRRQYFFEEEDVLNLDMFIRIESLIKNNDGGNHYRFSWWTEKDNDFFIKKPTYLKEGVIEASLLGHQLHKSSGYLNNESIVSSIRQVDEHEVIFESSYDNWFILEHTRLIDQDRYRSRNIYSWWKDELKIVENHHEIRTDIASP